MKWTYKEGNRMVCRGHIVDVVARRIVDGELIVEDGRIADIVATDEVPAEAPYYMPGFVDSHVHIESSMMVPAEFARIAVQYGTTGVVTDPHEIANVLGIEGIEFMLRSARLAKMHLAFGAPSCVPSMSDSFETSGARLDSHDIASLMARDEIHHLAEMMNYPGVLGGDPEVMAKIEAAHAVGKPVDGHAPGVVGEARRQYAAAGISTDHECSTLEEGRACIEAGMMVQIREGSAAKNLQMLMPLVSEAPDMVMLCTDDCHPTDLIRGHIDVLVRRLLREGYDVWDVLQVACLNAVRHYRLDWGLLQKGDAADFITVDRLDSRMRVLKTYIAGEKVYSASNYLTTINSLSSSVHSQLSMLHSYPNNFVAQPITVDDIAREPKPGDVVKVIRAYDGSLLTDCETIAVTGNPLRDAQHSWSEIQKIVVYNRYKEGAKPVVGFVRGFNLKDGAIAASIAHDCHNIVAIGATDEQIVQAINRIVDLRGGIVAIAGDNSVDLPLPIAGLISPLSGHEIAFRGTLLEEMAVRAGCTFHSPFITMAFMALPVIPAIKITDKGVLDSVHFRFI